MVTTCFKPPPNAGVGAAAAAAAPPFAGAEPPAGAASPSFFPTEYLCTKRTVEQAVEQAGRGGVNKIKKEKTKK